MNREAPQCYHLADLGESYKMDSIGHLCEAFKGTYAGEAMDALQTLYSTIETETTAFCKENEIACGPGCGTCCEHFMPDITTTEARLVAAYLLFIKKDEALIERVKESEGNTTGPCPLYCFNTPYHCSVYPSRPLICRLFGACANHDKNGNAVFRRCRYNVEKTMPEFLTLGGEVTVMQDYAYLLRSLDQESEEASMLGDAVSLQIEQLRFLASMLDLSDRPNPDDTPNPIAS